MIELAVEPGAPIEERKTVMAKGASGKNIKGAVSKAVNPKTGSAKTKKGAARGR
jgi:hypothetical protein